MRKHTSKFSSTDDGVIRQNDADADPVAAHVRELMADRAQWTGSHPTFCRSASTGPAGQRAPAHSLAGCAGHWPFLRTLGIEIVFGREGRFGTRTITITAGGESRSHTTVSIVSRVSNDGRGSPDFTFARTGTGALAVQTDADANQTPLGRQKAHSSRLGAFIPENSMVQSVSRALLGHAANDLTLVIVRPAYG